MKNKMWHISMAQYYLATKGRNIGYFMVFNSYFELELNDDAIVDVYIKKGNKILLYC